MKCESCGLHDCYGGKDCFELEERSRPLYEDPETLALTWAATALESRYYNQLTRVEEIMHFAEEMGWQHIGIAFCIGLAEEAKVLAEALKLRFRVTAACCKVAGIEKEALALEKIDADRTEAMCNPAAQALLLNDAGTDLNLIVGLCVGHDIIFSRQSNAPVTTLVVKDQPRWSTPVRLLEKAARPRCARKTTQGSVQVFLIRQERPYSIDVLLPPFVRRQHNRQDADRPLEAVVEHGLEHSPRHIDDGSLHLRRKLENRPEGRNAEPRRTGRIHGHYLPPVMLLPQ